MYGKLIAYIGGMSAGKTTAVLKATLWAKSGENRPVLVLKPAMDTRYGTDNIVSHDGLKTAATNLISINDLPEIDNPKTLVVLDECQFMIPPHVEGDIIKWTKNLLSKGNEVIVAGLDMDYLGNPFEMTAKFAALADEIHKLKANCTICGQPAGKTFKKSQSGDSIELGALDMYEARCNKHWKI